MIASSDTRKTIGDVNIEGDALLLPQMAHFTFLTDPHGGAVCPLRPTRYSVIKILQ